MKILRKLYSNNISPHRPTRAFEIDANENPEEVIRRAGVIKKHSGKIGAAVGTIAGIDIGRHVAKDDYAYHLSKIKSAGSKEALEKAVKSAKKASVKSGIKSGIGTGVVVAGVGTLVARKISKDMEKKGKKIIEEKKNKSKKKD